MQFPILALAILLAASTVPAGAQRTSAAPLTLVEAMRLAETAHPTVRSREAQLAAAEGARREAAPPLFNNPEFSTERTRLRANTPDGHANEWSVSIAQPFEIGGQQSLRRQAADAALEALRAEIEDARRQVRGEAAQRFHAVLAAQRRILIEQRSVELFDTTAQTVARRRTAGEDTRLDSNVAVVEAERARNALAAAREQWTDARADLATALQLPPTALPEVTGDLASITGTALPYSLEQLIASAQARPSLRAIGARENAARARLDLQRASRLPNVTVGLGMGREGPGSTRDRVTTLTVSVPLPLFNRNQAGIGQALTDLGTSQVERAALVRDQEAQVRRLWSRLNSQLSRIQRLQQSLLPAVADNQQLAGKSRHAGQIGLLDQLVINRQALDAERELNDALVEYHATRTELEIAAGWSLEGPAR